MRHVFFVTLIAVAGCASSMDRVRELRAAAPDWYEERKVELAGEGYPSIRDVPELGGYPDLQRDLGLSEAETIAALNMFQNDPRAEPTTETPDEMLAWVVATRRAVMGRLPAPDFMTDEEVAAIKALFDTPRGRL
ncbi:MAG: hypothetical protein QNI84_09035 [Henriciella sp.]|nr:hypothetical protein [Henriciella sp.]